MRNFIKWHFIFAATLVLFIYPSSGNAQIAEWQKTIDTEKDTNYWQIKQKFRTYYESKDEFTDKENRSAKFFKRAEFFWDTRADENGSLESYYKNLLQYKNTNDGSRTSQMCNTQSANWESVGPNYVQQGAVAQFSGVGRIESVAIDPVNNNIIYIGSNTSGIFKTTDGGETWTNITESMGIPGLGISSIAISPFNTNIIYAGTYIGTWHPSGLFYGVGIIFSRDGGYSWNEVTSLPGHSGNPTNTYNTRCAVIKFSNVQADLVVAGIGNDIWYCSNANSSNPTGILHVDPFTQSGVTHPNMNNKFPELINDIVLSDIYTSILYVAFWSDYTYATALYMLDLSISGLPVWTDITPSYGYQSMNFEMDMFPSPAAGGEELIVGFSYPSISLNDGWDKFELRWLRNTGTSLTVVRKQDWPHLWSQTSNYNKLNDLNFRLYRGLKCSPTSYGKVYASGVHTHVFEYDQSINKWEANKSDIYFVRGTHADIRDLAILPNAANSGDILFSANDGGIAKALTVGTSKTNEPIANFIHGSAGLNITQIFSFDIAKHDVNQIVLGAMDNGVQLKNSYNTFAKKTGGDGASVNFDPYDDSKVFFGVNGGNGVGRMYQNSISVLNWNDASNGYRIVIGRNETSTSPFAITKSGSNKIVYSADKDVWRHEFSGYKGYTSGTSENPYYTTNPNRQRNISVLATTKADPDMVIMGYNCHSDTNNNNLHKSTNRGTTWGNISDADIRKSNPQGVIISPTDADKIWVACANFNLGTSQNPINKVFYSNNGGGSFTDISLGLPNIPINTIVFHEGSGAQERVYVGTDLGVYYRGLYDTQWQCFNNNLPPTVITDLRIQECEGKIYASTFGRSIYKCDLAFTSSGPATTTVSNSTTWTGEIENMNHITVPNGVVLTLSNCMLRMAKDTKIKVEKGGELVVDQSTITSMCKCPWQGIVVEGDKFLSQIPSSNQGKVEIKNESTIEHAYLAVQLGSTTSALNGGVVVASSNSTFKNNKQAIYFHPYQGFVAGNPSIQLYNQSSIQDCKFELDDEYFAVFNKPIDHSNSNPWFISSDECDLQTIHANSFENNTSLPVYGVGIVVTDGNLKILSRCPGGLYPCSNYDINSFSKLKYGVHYSTTNANKTAWIDRNEFNLCSKSIVVNSAENEVITNNSIELQAGDFSTTGFYVNEGIQLNLTTGYTVQNNLIFGSCTENGGTVVAPCANTYGIFVSNSGPFPNEIYRNEINGLEKGILVEGLNADISGLGPYEFFGVGYDGLQIRCNKFTINSYDIYLEAATIAQYQGKAYGNMDELAGNLFSNHDMTCGAFSDHHYFGNGVQPLNTFAIPVGGGLYQNLDIWYSYIHHTEMSQYQLTDFPSEPFCYDPSGWLTTYAEPHLNTGYQNTCPEYFTSNHQSNDPPLGESLSKLQVLDDETIENEIAKLNELDEQLGLVQIDNLLEQDQKLQKVESWEELKENKKPLALKQLLQIITVSSIENKLDLIQILKNNEPLNIRLKKSVELHNWLVGVDLNYNTIGNRGRMESELSFVKLSLAKMVSHQIGWQLTGMDDGKFSTSSFESYFRVQGTLRSNRNSMKINLNTTRSTPIAYEKFELFEKEIRELGAAGSSIEDSALLDYFYTKKYGSGVAGALYTKRTGLPIALDRVVERTNDKNLKKEDNLTLDYKFETSEENIKVYPVPSSDFLNISLNKEVKEELVKIVAIDVQGREVLNYLPIDVEIDDLTTNFKINISDLFPGVYVVKLEFVNSSYSNAFIVK